MEHGDLTESVSVWFFHWYSKGEAQMLQSFTVCPLLRHLPTVNHEVWSWGQSSEVTLQIVVSRCYVLNCVSLAPLSPNSHVEALTPSVTVFGDTAFRVVIKVK